MLPELAALTNIFTDPTWTTRATAHPEGRHRDAYADIWRALNPDDPDANNLHSVTQFGTLSRDLADLEERRELLCCHSPYDHIPDKHAVATWDFDGTITRIR